MSTINKISKTIRDVRIKIGIDLTTEQSREILLKCYDEINASEPHRHIKEDTINIYNMIDVDKIISIPKNKYIKARGVYLTHVIFIYEHRGLSDNIEEILPPYVVFPEQSMQILHGRFSAAFEYFISKLSDSNIQKYFYKYTLPLGYKITCSDKKLEEKISELSI